MVVNGWRKEEEEEIVEDSPESNPERARNDKKYIPTKKICSSHLIQINYLLNSVNKNKVTNRSEMESGE